jgi:hypothetical protein
MRQLAFVLVVVAACQGGASTHDAALDGRSIDGALDGRPGDAATSDADTRACAHVGDCPCFSNHDCPATHACVSQDPGGTMVSCVPGPRGTGVTGAVCTGEADCASALCVDDASGGKRCSDLCGPGLPACPASLPTCLAGIGICAR